LNFVMGRATYLIAAICSGLLLGILSAVNAMGSYGLAPVVDKSAWNEWQLNSSDTKLVYTLGHFLSKGQLPPPKLAHSFVRTTDESGDRLRSDCVYLVEGKITPARWWAMSVSQAGGLTGHSVVTAGEAIVDQDDVLKVTISARPMPGNWLAPDGSTLALTYDLNEVANGQDVQLPTVTKKGC
jgi:hypothetical protein